MVFGSYHSLMLKLYVGTPIIIEYQCISSIIMVPYGTSYTVFIECSSRVPETTRAPYVIGRTRSVELLST